MSNVDLKIQFDKLIQIFQEKPTDSLSKTEVLKILDEFRSKHFPKENDEKICRTRKTVHKGNFTVKKESRILYPLLKQHKSREVFCELSVEEISEEKRFSFKIYHKTKPIQLIYEFPIDENVFVTQKANRELVLNHQIGAEFLETEKKELSQWIKVFPVFETSLKIPEVYSHSLSSPPRLEASIQKPSADRIFVALYDHRKTSSNSSEIEFNRGDLIYVTNDYNEHFYYAHKIVLPWAPENQPPLGIVFKNYLENLYEPI